MVVQLMELHTLLGRAQGDIGRSLSQADCGREASLSCGRSCGSCTWAALDTG